MGWDQIAAFLVALGVGGAVGALLAASIAGARLAAAFRDFASLLRPYLQGRTDAQSLEVRDAFEAFEVQVEAFESSLARLRRAFKLK